MLHKPRTRLRLESLDSRITPAINITSAGGHLYVFGTSTADLIILDVNAPSVVVKSALPSLTVLGTYNVTGNIHIGGGGGDDGLNVNLQSAFPGSIFIRGEAGNDNVQVNAFNINVPQSISGALNINFGPGDDSMQSNGVQPGTLNLDGDLGHDTAWLSNMTVAGNASITRVNDLQLGFHVVGLVPPQPLTVGNNLVINNSVDGALANTMVFHDQSKVLGNLTYTGGSGADSVQFQYDGFFVLGGNPQVVGQTTINAGAGSNTLDIQNSAQFGGFNYSGGTGTDSIRFSAGVQFTGAVSLNTGAGNNLYDFGNGIFSGNASFSLTAGAGNDLVGPFWGLFAGPITVNAGNGSNSFGIVWGNAASAFTYMGGSGTDAVEIGGIQFFNASVMLGAGADTFTYTAGNTSVGGITVNFGADTDTDTLVTNNVAINWPSTYLNLP